MNKTSLIPAARIERRILLLRGQKVMLDFDLAELYEVPAKVLNQSVKRNLERFPEDFMFQLSGEETQLVMRSQIVTSSDGSHSKSTETLPPNWSQIVSICLAWRGRPGREFSRRLAAMAPLLAPGRCRNSQPRRLRYGR